MAADSLLLFFIASILLALTPGPDNLFVLTQALAFGKRAGLLVVAGLCSGLVIHTTAVTLGVAALITASPIAINTIKAAGAAYLLYLAWKSWQTVSGNPSLNEAQTLNGWQLCRRGFIMNVTNPKVALFFLAFLPQFVNSSSANSQIQIAVLGLVFIVSTMLVFGGIAVLAGLYSRNISRSESRRQMLGRVVAVIFVALAFNLFTTWI